MANLRSIGNALHPVGPLTVANYALNPSMELPDFTQLANARVNLCTNPSLEMDTTGWGSSSSFWTNTSTIARSTAWSVVGSASLLCTTPGSAATEGCWFRGGVLANTTYTVSATIKSVSGRPITLHLRDETNNVSGTASTSVSAGNVVRVSATITTGASAATLLVAFGGDATVAASKFYVDALLIEQTSTVNPYFDGTHDLTVSRTNLCTNPSFEIDTSGWIAVGTNLPTFVTTGARKLFGTKSGLITWPATGIGTAIQYDVATTVGAVYSVSLFVFVPSGNPTITLTESGDGATQTSTVFDDWQRLSLIFVATDVTTHVQITPTSDGGGTCYVEAVLIEPGPLGDYFDGSLPRFATTGITQSWNGDAHSSASSQFIPVGTVAWSGTPNASSSSRWDVGVKDWNTSNSTVTQVALARTIGIYCAKMVPNTTSLIPSMSQTFEVIDSTNYSINFQIYIPVTLTGGGISLQLNSYDVEDGAITVDFIPLLLSGSPTNGFVRVATTYMTPAGTATLTVAVRPTNQPTSTSDVIYVDSFMFEQADSPSPFYIDGSFAGYCWSGDINDSTTLQTALPSVLNFFGTTIWQNFTSPGDALAMGGHTTLHEAPWSPVPLTD